MNYNFIVVQKEVQEVRHDKVKLFSNVKTFLCIRDNVTGMVLPHPLSNFIKSEFERKSLSINAQKSYAEDIKKFLNYILECIKDEDATFMNLEREGIRGLRLQHGAMYISYLTQRVRNREIQPENVRRVDRILTRFYRWLSEQKIIKEHVQYREETRSLKGEKITITYSPFDNFELGTEYPNKSENKQVRDRKLHDFGNGRLDLVNLFLRVAEIEAPDIALGIAFQFYGGLRRAEVLNLLRSSVKEPSKNGSGEFTVEIKDNWKLLFPKKKLTVAEQVKKERIQAIFKVPIILELYRKHKMNLSKLEKKGKIKNQLALFSSFHTGNPISGMAYWERFTKVKDRFLKILENNEKDYTFLISKPWSTHIGRGVFTNMLVFLLGWSASEVMIARGDSYIQSSKDYIEELNVKNKTEEAIELIAKATLQVESKNYTKIEDLRSM